MNAFISGILDRLGTELDPTALGSSLAQFLANITVGVAIYLAFYLVWRMVDPVLRYFLRRTRVDETTASFTQAVVKYAILIIGAAQALSAAGTNTATVLGGLGIAGLTIGFAARDALSNFISAILVYWDRPFVIGDLVEVGNNYGKVDQITLRSTRIVTPDGRMLAVPNTEIINSTVASYTNFPHLRLDITATIGVNENIDRAREVLLGLVQDHDRFMNRPAPRVVVTQLGDYSIEIQLQVWLDDEHDHVHWTAELKEQVFEALTEAGIDMPYETIQLAPHEVTVRQ